MQTRRVRCQSARGAQINRLPLLVQIRGVETNRYPQRQREKTGQEYMDCCSACWNETDARLGPCGHAMCRACAARWCSVAPTCPMCRVETFGLVGGVTASESALRVPMPRGTHAGVTVACAEGGGVLVQRVHPNDRFAACGVRKGMVLESINGIPIGSPGAAVRMLQAGIGHEVCLSVRPPPAPRWSPPRWTLEMYRTTRAFLVSP